MLGSWEAKGKKKKKRQAGEGGWGADERRRLSEREADERPQAEAG